MTVEFKEFPKMARLNRECIITEKIDGTNACIRITDDGQFLTGKRTGWCTPENDNFGFSRWAHEHRDELMQLGVGTHFGEWWGIGIQRTYGLNEKRFSLFNTHRWCLHGETPRLISSPDAKVEKYQESLPECVGLVPVLYEGKFTTFYCTEQMMRLRDHGSVAAPGFMKPEGIVVFHVAAGIGFKATLEGDEKPKSIHKSALASA